MSRDGEIREIKPVTSDEWNYVRPLFFFARIILLDIIVNGNVKKKSQEGSDHDSFPKCYRRF